MTKVLKEFIENNIELIENNGWKQLFMNAYNDCLLTSEVQDLHNILLTSDIYDSTQLRNYLLYETIAENLKYVELQHNRSFNLSMKDKYIVQFLRVYLNNTFGFSERDAVQFVYENQANLGITLLPFDRVDGQSGIRNYEIIFDN